MTEKPLQNCNKCGLCLSVCPVYNVLKEEQASPRARLQLIKAYDNDSIPSSYLLKDIISKCLMCGSCAANCPAGIDHYSTFMKMRQEMNATQGDSIAVKSLIYLLAKEYRLGLSTGFAKFSQKIAPKALTEKFRLGNIPIKRFPKFNPVPFRNAHEEVIFPDKKEKGVVVYFTGCATNYLYDDTGRAVIEILKHMGYKIIIPKDQTCCSIPMLYHGAKDKAYNNIRTNINTLKDIKADKIFVDCSTCGTALKKEYLHFARTSDINPKDAEVIASKVMDILSFIHEKSDSLEFKDTWEDPPETAIYHAPCHSKNSFQSIGRIESLLQENPLIHYKRVIDMDECCGGGGTFFYEYPDVSRKMIEKKVKNAKDIGTRYWLTDCPVCRLNLLGNLDPKDNIEVLHPVTIINSGVKKE